MKRSEFAEQLMELVNTTDRPITTREMAEAVGCSAQRAYVWVKEHRGELVALGTDPHGGTLFVGRDNPLAPTTALRPTTVKSRVSVPSGTNGTHTHTAGSIEVGTTMTITRLVLGEGVIVQLETDDGRIVEATLHL